MEFEVTFTDNTHLEELAAEFPLCAVRALNTVGGQTERFAESEILARYNVSSQDVKSAFSREPAKPGQLTYTIKASGVRTRLFQYGPMQGPVGVTSEVIRGSMVTVAHAFVARMPSGHWGVFLRDKVKRPHIRMRGVKGAAEKIHIQEQYRPSISEMFFARSVMEKVSAFSEDLLPAQMDEEVRKIVGEAA